MALLIAAVGVANSSKTDQVHVPANIINCTIDVLPWNHRSLQHSVCIYCGLFITLLLIIIAYQSLIITPFHLFNVSAINLHFKKFLLIDHIINNISLGLSIGGIVGSYLMGWLWSSYASATSDQSNNNADTIVSVLMHLAFVS